MKSIVWRFNFNDLENLVTKYKEKMEIFLQVTSSRLKFITNYNKLITNYDRFAYYKLKRLVVTNCDSFF